jgi:hypothetical protein
MRFGDSDSAGADAGWTWVLFGSTAQVLSSGRMVSTSAAPHFGHAASDSIVGGASKLARHDEQTAIVFREVSGKRGLRQSVIVPSLSMAGRGDSTKFAAIDLAEFA